MFLRSARLLVIGCALLLWSAATTAPASNRPDFDGANLLVGSLQERLSTTIPAGILRGESSSPANASKQHELFLWKNDERDDLDSTSSDDQSLAAPFAHPTFADPLLQAVGHFVAEQSLPGYIVDFSFSSRAPPATSH